MNALRRLILILAGADPDSTPALDATDASYADLVRDYPGYVGCDRFGGQF